VATRILKSFHCTQSGAFYGAPNHLLFQCQPFDLYKNLHIWSQISLWLIKDKKQPQSQSATSEQGNSEANVRWEVTLYKLYLKRQRHAAQKWTWSRGKARDKFSMLHLVLMP